MANTFSLPRWAHLAKLDDETLQLFSTALLIARDEYPELDVNQYAAQIQHYVTHLEPMLARISLPPLKMAAVNRYLFDEIGYAGDHQHYYDPRNSYLNEVFDRRLGNPISLAIVQIEVAHRLGIPLEGISFPGNFLVRLPLDSGILVMDPFNGGRPLGLDEIRERIRPLLNETILDHATHLSRILDPAPHRAILIRMLRNLHAVYADEGKWDKAARCADRILKLLPNQAEAVRDRGLAYLELGHLSGARPDLERYLSLSQCRRRRVDSRPTHSTV